MKSAWYATWSGEVPPLLLHQGSQCDCRPQIIGGHGQQRHHIPITAATVHNSALAPIQCAHTIEAWSRSILSDWLYHENHTEGNNQELAGVNINMHALSMAIDIPVKTSVEDIKMQ